MPEESESARRAVAMAWDPCNPATLLLPTSSGGKLNYFASHDGIGCNAQEIAALMNLLDAQDAFHKSETSSSSLLTLSKTYRQALSDCVHGWEENMGEEENQENLELLKIAYAVVHLSETFLLLPASTSNSMDYYEHSTNMPGAVTAELVRYLRLHHMTDASDFLSEETIQEIFNSHHPDQLDGGELYWRLLESYAIRGCLEDVWGLLTRHSICRHCSSSLTKMEGLDAYQAAMLEEDQQGFEALRAVLLSAPIPGGRTDEYDAAVDFPEADGEEEEEYIEGITPNAFKLWESNNRAGNGDYPSSFHSQAAKETYQIWKRSIQGIPQLQKLKRRIPRLSKLLAILSGDFSSIEFDSWSEEFCAELLYKIPDLRLVDINVRCQHIMKQYEAGSQGFEEVILSVMKGNAGRVIEVMHELGGGSGAALPAAMTSLLCNLLNDAQIMPQASEKYNLQTELLLDTAFAIHSSLVSEGHADLATRLAVRFLLPQVEPKRDVRIAASLTNILEHYAPKTDPEANALLELLREKVERKNIRLLDGCVSICTSRYLSYRNEHRPGGAAHWLLVGMEFESLILSNMGVCQRLLETYCSETSTSLLKGLLGEGQGTSVLFAKAKEIITSLSEDESGLAQNFQPANCLELIVNMSQAMLEQDLSLVASCIVQCLEKQAGKGGVVSSLAPSPVHWDMLRLAKGILLSSRKDNDVATYNVAGMQVLLEVFTEVAASKDMFDQSLLPEEMQEMRLALGEGLMRAFVAENALKKSSFAGKQKLNIQGIYAPELGKYAREKQEMVVSKMLEF